MRKNARRPFSFDSRSVVLLAAMSFGSAGAINAYAADAPGTAKAPMAQSQSAPPMTTSPAFGPSIRADKGTGSANDPNKRPEIEATRPTAAPSALDRDKANANEDAKLGTGNAKTPPAMSK